MLSEFERRAWSNRTSAERHAPEMACKATVDKIERGELKNIRHIAVIAVENVDGADLIHLIQAGDMSELAVEGALARAIKISQYGE